MADKISNETGSIVRVLQGNPSSGNDVRRNAMICCAGGEYISGQCIRVDNGKKLSPY